MTCCCIASFAALSRQKKVAAPELNPPDAAMVETTREDRSVDDQHVAIAAASTTSVRGNATAAASGSSIQVDRTCRRNSARSRFGGICAACVGSVTAHPAHAADDALDGGCCAACSTDAHCSVGVD